MSVPAFTISGSKKFSGYDETYIDDFGKYRTSEYTEFVVFNINKSITIMLITSKKLEEVRSAALRIIRLVLSFFSFVNPSFS